MHVDQAPNSIAETIRYVQIGCWAKHFTKWEGTHSIMAGKGDREIGDPHLAPQLLPVKLSFELKAVKI